MRAKKALKILYDRIAFMEHYVATCNNNGRTSYYYAEIAALKWALSQIETVALSADEAAVRLESARTRYES